ncbi:hypothetical protein [Gordonibacter urolithinfaciens]|uniref:hypothetical protein n=1 Tax=Gordonibacter urolithinfaciens TaxID=1335613 RepID=UPI0034B65CDA
MTTQEQITRLTEARNTLRNKAINLGLANIESSSKIDAVATAFGGISNNGAVKAEVKEGDTYTIPEGYHNGSGSVSGVSGGGNYTLQTKTVTPTKSAQSVTPDDGSYGLSSVTVNPIPEAYQDVTSVTAGAGDVLATKTVVDATGKVVAGTMPNNGAVSAKLDATTKNYTVPKGYHDGTGSVSISTEEKSATPTKASQSVTPTAGKVLSKVTVAAIPAAYQDVTGVTATADKVLDGSVFVDSDGEAVEGTMADKGAVSATINGLTVSSYTIPAGYHNGLGKVSLTNDIEAALAAI